MILVDSNVIIDVMVGVGAWSHWSRDRLSSLAEANTLAINPIIYAELSAGIDSIERLDQLLGNDFQRLILPYEAGFLAGRAFVDYRRRGGQRASPLPDFYIGAHAAVADLSLLTRDPRRYRSYFPTVSLISPDG